MPTDAGSIFVRVNAETSNFTRGLDRASRDMDGFGRRIGSSLAGVAKAGLLVAGAAGLGAIAVTLHAGIGEWQQSAMVAAQTGAVLKSTGGAANVTAKQVDALSTALMNKTGIDDEAIKSGENMLLTFTGIRNEVGKGNDVFTQATKAVVDMDTAMTHGNSTAETLSHTSILVGKALNDPVKGATALRRVGVQLTEQQQEQIKAFVKSGETMKAQKIILGELTREFGGSARAIGKTLPGQLRILRESFNNLAGTLVGGLVPSFARAVGSLNSFMARLGAARSIHAKLEVIWEGLQSAGESLEAALAKAVRMVNWATVWSKAAGIAEGLAARFKATDWTAVGGAIGSGIADSVAKGAAAGQKLAAAFADMTRSIDWVKLGRAMGPGLAAAIATAFVTLTNPSFWIKNWDLALAVGLVAFGGSLGRLVGRLGAMLAKPFGDAVLLTAGVIARLSPKLADAFLVGMLRLPGLLTSLGARLLAPIMALFSRLGRLAQFTVKVLGVQAAINAVVQFAKAIYDKLQDIIGWFRKLPGQIIGAIGKVGSLLSGIGWALVNGLKKGMENAFETVLGWARSAASKLKSVFTFGLAGSPEYFTLYVGHDLMAALARGIQEAMPQVEGATAKAAQLVKAKLQAQELVATAQQWGRIIGAENAKAILAGFLQADQSLKGQFVAAARAKAAEMAQAIRDAKGAFRDAFSQMAQQALDAFDAKWAGWVPPAQKLLDKMQLEDQVNSAKQAITDAGAQLAEARAQAAAAQTPEEIATAQEAIVAAEKNLGAAQRAQVELNLQLQAAVQQKAHDARIAKDRENLAKQLTQLQQALAKHPGEWDKMGAQIRAILAKYDIPMVQAGQRWASNFADGIRKGIAAAVAAAKALATAVDAYMPHSPAKKGPLSFDVSKSGEKWTNMLWRGLNQGGPKTFSYETGGASLMPSTSAAGASGGPSITIVVQGSLIHERQLEDVVVSAARNWSVRNGPVFTRTAGALA